MSTPFPDRDPDLIHRLWPWCATCEKLVEVLESSTDPITHTITFTARCHGAVEQTVIDSHQFNWRPEQMEQGVAFWPKKQLT